MTVPVRAALIDLDGTVYSRGRLLPGAAEAVAAVRAAGVAVRFLTNTDARPPEAVRADVAALGLDIAPGELFTPVVAAGQLLARVADAVPLLLVSDAVRAALARPATGTTPTHVIVGDCRELLCYRVLDEAFRALRAGAELVALQRGRFFQSADGDHLDTGAVVAALEYAAGTTATVVGKPAEAFFTSAAASAGCAAAECVVVGDDPTTDIAGGRAVGARTVQVRTGKYADLAAGGGGPAPDRTIDSIADLPAVLAAPEPPG